MSNVQKLDCCFLVCGNSKKTYQELSKTYSAIEPPTWALLLAESTRAFGFNVNIIDANAENLTEEEIYNRIKKLSPKLICFVVYGQNVNAGTVNMTGVIHIASYLTDKNINIPMSIIGSHVQALPTETLKKETMIDFVFTNEAVYALRNILKLDCFDSHSLSTVNGIAYRHEGEIKMTPSEKIVPTEKMDIDLPGYAWDLLPFDKKPLDLYRAPMWHAEYDFKKRTPYASLQTSLGCMFHCNFCTINIINRDNNDEVGVASNYSTMRFWSTDFIIKEFDKLISMGVKTIRIVDEMFLLNPKYYVPLCKELAKRNKDDSLRIWSYSRIDTVKRPAILELVRKAGIKWLALGIESGDKSIRLEVAKGKFEDVDVKKVIERVHEADIHVMANYIFGLPGDTIDTINKTLELSLELCTAGWNTYGAMALPGSQLYKDAIDKGIKLPESYEGYSFHSFETLPLPTESLSAKEIITLRDNAFTKYHTYKPFLKLIEKKFGKVAADNILQMTKIKLKRKIKGDQL